MGNAQEAETTRFPVAAFVALHPADDQPQNMELIRIAELQVIETPEEVYNT